MKTTKRYPIRSLDDFAAWFATQIKELDVPAWLIDEDEPIRGVLAWDQPIKTPRKRRKRSTQH